MWFNNFVHLEKFSLFIASSVTISGMDSDKKQREHHAPRAGSKASKKKAVRNKKLGIKEQPKSTHPGVVLFLVCNVGILRELCDQHKESNPEKS